MRKLLLGICLTIFLLPQTTYGQGSWLDATNVVGNGDVIITDMEIDSNGDSYIMGWFNTNIVSTVGSINSNGNYDIFLLKINSDGTHAWLKGFGGNFPICRGGLKSGLIILSILVVQLMAQCFLMLQHPLPPLLQMLSLRILILTEP